MSKYNRAPRGVRWVQSDDARIAARLISRLAVESLRLRAAEATGPKQRFEDSRKETRKLIQAVAEVRQSCVAKEVRARQKEAQVDWVASAP